MLEWLSYHNAKACVGLAPGIKEVLPVEVR